MFDFEKSMIDAVRQLTPEQVSKLPFSGRMVSDVRDVNLEKRTVTAVINTAKIDTYRSVVSPRGMDRSYFDEFKTVKRGHTWEIGKSNWLNPDRKDKMTEWSSMATISDTTMGRETLQLVQDEVLKGSSVGIRLITMHMWDETARKMYEEDYADVGYKATPEMDWYIREWVLGEWSIVGSPANDEAKISRAVSGMSQDTQDFVWGEWFKVRFPEMQREIESLKSNLVVVGGIEKQFSDKFDAFKIEIEKRLGEGQGQREGTSVETKPLETAGQAILGAKEAARFVEKQIEAAVKYQLGKI